MIRIVTSSNLELILSLLLEKINIGKEEERPLEKSGELISPRKLHNTSWGFLCPAETPEGQSIGIVKNMKVHVHAPKNYHIGTYLLNT